MSSRTPSYYLNFNEIYSIISAPTTTIPSVHLSLSLSLSLSLVLFLHLV